MRRFVDALADGATRDGLQQAIYVRERIERALREASVGKPSARTKPNAGRSVGSPSNLDLFSVA